jgi:hypothetical protein
MRAFPGVELVAPSADTFSFIRAASLVIAIQGTIGLEAALLRKPVIMLGDSPFTVFPGVSRVGEIPDLPALIRAKLVEAPPERRAIVSGYAEYLAPYLPASSNDWNERLTDDEIAAYVELFAALEQFVAAPAESAPSSSRAGRR